MLSEPPSLSSLHVRARSRTGSALRVIADAGTRPSRGPSAQASQVRAAGRGRVLERCFLAPSESIPICVVLSLPFCDRPAPSLRAENRRGGGGASAGFQLFAGGGTDPHHIPARHSSAGTHAVAVNTAHARASGQWTKTHVM